MGSVTFDGVTLPATQLMSGALFGKSILRIGAIALALCTLTFAAGVAGDLAEPARSGVRVVVRIPPELPQDTLRAGPIAGVMTSTASAAVPQRAPRQLRQEPVVEAEDVILPIEKPRRAEARADVKHNPDRAPKPADA